MRRLSQIFASTVVLLLPLSLFGAEPENSPPAADAEIQAPEKPASGKEFTLDLGKFSSFTRGIVLQLGKNDDGSSRVNVEVDRPGNSGTGVKVDVRRDANGKPHVDVDVQVDSHGGTRNAGDANRTSRNDVNVDLGAPGGAEDTPVEAPKPAAAPARENFFGVFTRTLPPALAAQLGGVVGENEGLLVLAVLPDSPAAKAGLKKHDIIVRYDDQKLATTEKLKALIAADNPGRTVKLAIVRAASPQTVEVVMGEREAAPPRDEKTSQLDKEARLGEQLADETHQLRIISKKLIQVPGVIIQLGGSEVPVATRPKAVSGKKLLITTESGNQFKVDVKYDSADGTAVEQSFEGTPAELQEKMKELPDEIRTDAHRMLDSFDSDKAQSRAFRFNVEPRVEGDRRILRISMQRPGSAGETRLLEIEQRFDGHESIQVADLMRIDVVASELKDLGPAVREKLEATLNRVQIPEVRVGVEKSQ